MYLQNRIYNVDRQRFKMQRANNGIFNLLISSVNTSDAGIYRCRENDGRYPGEACTELIVFGETNLILEQTKIIYLRNVRDMEG